VEFIKGGVQIQDVRLRKQRYPYIRKVGADLNVLRNDHVTLLRMTDIVYKLATDVLYKAKGCDIFFIFLISYLIGKMIFWD
jgi:hypothetical protein